jgi:hypothetical protein
LSEPRIAELVFLMLHGMVRWDGVAVADAVRSGSLSPLQTEALARLLDGTAASGLKLELQGQGRGLTTQEKAERYERIVAVGEFIAERLRTGETWEAAVIDAAEHFGVSEPTVARDLQLYRVLTAES